eukprot:SAG31_NODE_1353_length_8663_cov_6.353690_7_plen_73_part_00
MLHCIGGKHFKITGHMLKNIPSVGSHHLAVHNEPEVASLTSDSAAVKPLGICFSLLCVLAARNHFVVKWFAF